MNFQLLSCDFERIIAPLCSEAAREVEEDIGKSMSISHCLDLDLNGKRPGVTSDSNFTSCLIVRS